MQEDDEDILDFVGNTGPGTGTRSSSRQEDEDILDLIVGDTKILDSDGSQTGTRSSSRQEGDEDILGLIVGDTEPGDSEHSSMGSYSSTIMDERMDRELMDAIKILASEDNNLKLGSWESEHGSVGSSISKSNDSTSQSLVLETITPDPMKHHKINADTNVTEIPDNTDVIASEEIPDNTDVIAS